MTQTIKEDLDIYRSPFQQLDAINSKNYSQCQTLQSAFGDSQQNFSQLKIIAYIGPKIQPKKEQRTKRQQKFKANNFKKKREQIVLHETPQNKKMIKNMSQQQFLQKIQFQDMNDGSFSDQMEDIDFSEDQFNNYLTQQAEQIVNYVQKSQKRQRILIGRKANPYDDDVISKIDRVIAALAFVSRGYGIGMLKQQVRNGNAMQYLQYLPDQKIRKFQATRLFYREDGSRLQRWTYNGFCIDDTKYKSVSGSVVRQSFRKLQMFLTRQCRLDIDSISGQRMKSLQTLLLNCRTTLNNFGSKTFVQLVKITFNLEKIMMNQAEAIKLHSIIIQALNKKLSLNREDYYNDSPQLPYKKQGQSQYSNIIKNLMKKEKQIKRDQYQQNTYISHFKSHEDLSEQKMDKQIIFYYVRTSSISQVRDTLMDKYPMLDVRYIRNLMRRVLRYTVRQLQRVLQVQKNRSRYSSLSGQKIKWIVQSGEAGEIRRRIFNIYLSGFSDISYLQRNYRQIIEFGKNKIYDVL